MDTCNAATSAARKSIDAFFELADAIIAVRSLIRQAGTTYRWAARRDDRDHTAYPRDLLS